MAGVFAAGRRRARWSVAVGLCLTGAVSAQPPDYVPPPPNPFKLVQAQDPPPVEARSTPLPPPGEVYDAAAPTVTSPLNTLAQPVFGEPLPPLPGSVEDRYHQELAARHKFTTGTWKGTVFTALPNSLLWEPPLAVKRDPRMQFLSSNLPNYTGGNTLDTAIGMTMGLYRAEFEGSDFAAQLDIFGLVLTRLSPDDLLLADYRFGLPVTFRWGWWQGKIGYEHTSAHLGDELIRAGQATNIPGVAKDELVIGVGRIVFDNLRLYGHAAYAFGFQMPGLEGTTKEKSRFDFGAEWYYRCPTGWQGTPFVAANVEYRGDQNYEPNYTIQAGWFWRNPTQRLGTFRLFVERYDGRSPYGQIFTTREQYTSFGFGFDY